MAGKWKRPTAPTRSGWHGCGCCWWWRIPGCCGSAQRWWRWDTQRGASGAAMAGRCGSGVFFGRGGKPFCWLPLPSDVTVAPSATQWRGGWGVRFTPSRKPRLDFENCIEALKPPAIPLLQISVGLLADGDEPDAVLVADPEAFSRSLRPRPDH